jgi:hypothetical protein
MEKIVAAGVKAQSEIDYHLTKAYKAALRLVKVTEDGVGAGMVPKAISAKLIIAEARELPGLIAGAAASAAKLHAKQTIICQENGVDTPTPANVGGVTIQGGGGR